MTQPPDAYARAGVSIAAGDALVRAIGPMARATARPGASAELGGFGAFFDPRAAGYLDPLLVATTDGVGTKLRLAIDTGRHDSVGQDLVAMCVNDLLVQCAEPLLFLDYFASAHLDVAIAEAVVRGIAAACAEAGCALVGGETAEMPGMYAPGDYDLAGFALGAVERGQQLTGAGVAPGDVLIGVASSGAHSNGFSLIRKILADSGADLAAPAPFDQGDGHGRTLADTLLEPTRLYVRDLLPLARGGRVKAMAHITGGGLIENIPRVLPEGCHAAIDAATWTLPPLFAWLQAAGDLTPADLARTFNCGWGMVLVAASVDAPALFETMSATSNPAQIIGYIEPGSRACTVSGPPGTWGQSAHWTTAGPAAIA